MKELTLATLIKGVEKTIFVADNSARLCLGAKKIETLFDSLLRGFPISSFLFWEVPDQKLHA